MGYAKTDTKPAALVYKTMSFQGVGGEDAKFTLSQLNVAGISFSGWEGDYIATIKDNGAQGQYYSWDPDEEGWFEANEFGEPDLDAPADDVVLEMNKAVYIYCGAGDDVTFSGAVLGGDSEIYCNPTRPTYTGNFTPTQITFGDLVVGEGEFSGWEGDYISTIKANGAQDLYYSWDPDEQAWFEANEFGEPDLDAPANAIPIYASQAFILYSGSAITINIPSPIKKN